MIAITTMCTVYAVSARLPTAATGTTVRGQRSAAPGTRRARGTRRRCCPTSSNVGEACGSLLVSSVGHCRSVARTSHEPPCPTRTSAEPDEHAGAAQASGAQVAAADGEAGEQVGHPDEGGVVRPDEEPEGAVLLQRGSSTIHNASGGPSTRERDGRASSARRTSPGRGSRRRTAPRTSAGSRPPGCASGDEEDAEHEQQERPDERPGGGPGHRTAGRPVRAAGEQGRARRPRGRRTARTGRPSASCANPPGGTGPWSSGPTCAVIIPSTASPRATSMPTIRRIRGW